jgi:hypothetical protein
MRTALLCIAAVSFACGGSSEMTRQLSVGGTYATQVALLPAGNTCSGVSVQNNPTVVAHTPGAETLSLTHAGTTYSGTITQTGAFSVPATAVSGGAFTVSIAGQFTAMGLTATAHVAQGQPPCGYDVSWTGTKSGNPNTFP